MGKGKQNRVHVTDSRPLGAPLTPLLSPAQETMKADMAKSESTLSREGQMQRRSGELVEEITMESDLKLTPLEWQTVRELVRQGIQAGRELERDL